MGLIQLVNWGHFMPGVAHLWQVSSSATSDDVPSDILDKSNTVDQVLLGMAQTTFHKKYKFGS